MQYILTGAAIFAAISGASAKTAAQLCSGSAVNDGGNFYCKAVNKIQYSGLPTSGSYQDVYAVRDGQCQFQPVSYSGVGGPLKEQLSLHLRGPLIMNQTAVYYPSGSPKTKRSSHHLHGHQRFHRRHHQAHKVEEREADAVKRQVGAVVTATIDGKVVTWLNNWDGKQAVNPTPAPAAAPAIAPAAAPPAAPAPANPAPAAGQPVGAAAIPAAPKAAPAPSNIKLEDGEWGRAGYFRIGAEPTGLSFLNSWGAAPGENDPDKFLGFKLGHAKFDGTLKAFDEVMIFSDEECDSSCGFTRPGAVNKKGFGGARKMFAFQFSMADDGSRNWEGKGDWPAIWSLNAKIPRLQQYGKCSCWESGCGEFDMFETLAPGDQRCKSTFHAASGKGGGDSNFLKRPVDPRNPVTGIVLFYDDSVTVAYVDNFNFDEKLSAHTIEQIMALDDNSDNQSLFALAG